MKYKIEAVRQSGKRMVLAAHDKALYSNHAVEVSKWSLQYPHMHAIEARTIDNNTLLMRRRGG